MGAFDDLIPAAAKPAAAPGAFDDLIPAAAPPPSDGRRLWERASAGLAQAVGGTIQGAGEGLESLLAAPMDLASTLREVATGVPLPNPVGAAAGDVGAFGADVADVGRELSRAASAGITRPDSLAAALGNPGNALRYYGGILAESAPLMLGAMATRNPTAGAALMGVGTGGQTYGQERTGGASVAQAGEQAIAAGLLEALLSKAPLDTALTAGLPAGRRVALATAQEAGTEAITGGGQEALGAVLAGRDVDPEAVRNAVIDSLIVGAPLGAAEGVLGRGPAAPPASAAPPLQTTPASAPTAAPPADIPAANLGDVLASIPPESVADLAAVLPTIAEALGVGADLPPANTESANVPLVKNRVDGYSAGLPAVEGVPRGTTEPGAAGNLRGRGQPAGERGNAPQRGLADALALDEDAYIRAVNPEGKRISPEDRVRVFASDLSTPADATPAGTMPDTTGQPVTLLRTPTGLFAQIDGQTVGSIETEDGETLNTVAEDFQGRGIGTLLAREFIREQPFAPSGGFTEAGEATRRKAFRQLREEADATRSTPPPVERTDSGFGAPAAAAPGAEPTALAEALPRPADPSLAGELDARLPRETLPDQRAAGLPQDRTGVPAGQPQRPAREAPQGEAAGAPEAQGARAGDVASRTPGGQALSERNRAIYDRAGELAQRTLDRRQQQTSDGPRRRAGDAPQSSRPAITEGRFQAFDIGMADTDVSRAVRDVVREWRGDAPAVNVVQEVADIPDANVRARIESDPAGNTIEGVFDGKGGVYLIASNLRDPQRALEVLAHEAFGHYGVEGVMGRDGLAKVLADVGRLKQRRADLSQAMQGALASTEERYPDADPVTFARELLAVMAERGVKGGIIDRVLAAVRDFLRKLGLPVDRWADATLRDIVAQGFRRVERAGASPNQARERGMAASRPSQNITETPAFRPEQIKSATGNSGAFDPNDKRIAFSRRTPAQATAQAQQTRAQVAQQVGQPQGAAGWSYDRGRWEGIKGQRDRARIALQDKMLAWRDVQNDIATQLAKDIPDAQNVYRLENLMHGRVETQFTALEQNAVRPLVAAMEKAGVTPEALGEYLMARHAVERNANIAAKNPGMPEGGSGLTNAEAETILANADKAKLDPLAARVDAITKATRRRLLQHGIITQAQFDAMEQQYQFYVPLRGIDTPVDGFPQGGAGTGRGIDGRAQPVKGAMGRGAGNLAKDILGEVIGDAQRAIIAQEKARVGRAMMRLVLANPNPDLWEVEPVQTERKLDATGQVYEAVINDANDPSIVMVRVEGKPYRVRINSQPLAQAMNNVGVEQMSSVSRAAGAINRYFSAILTKYNPAFTPVNATRDALFGLTGLAVEHGEGTALKAALAYPKAAAASFRYAINKTGPGKWDQLAQRFAAAGGRTGYVSMPSAERLQETLGMPTGRVEKVKRVLGLGKFQSSVPNAVLDAIGNVNDAVENALRLSAFGTLTEQGMSDEAAAEYAKNLTVNFNRKGQKGAALNAWFLFYNAALQGAKRTGDVLRRPKTYAYLGALAGIQVAATMAAMGMEDDDGEKLWDKIPDHVKRRNIVIPVNQDYIITIPMPYGFNVFTYGAGRIAASVLDEDDEPNNRAAKLTGDLLSAATESLFPVPVGDGPLGFLPTVLRIPVNVQTNRDDFGRRIRNETPFPKFDVPRATMGRPDTLELFKVAATGLNRIGGGDDYTPPPMTWFDHAPEDIEYLLKELTGGTGKFLVDVATVGQKATGDDPLKLKDAVILNRFATNVDQQAAEQSRYYERSDRLNRSLEKVRDVFEREGEDAAEMLLKSLPELEGAEFKRRKRRSDNGEAGSVITDGGRPTMVATDDDTVFGRYKAAEKVIRARNESLRAAYAAAPATLLPNAATRQRDAAMKQANKEREAAQSAFNAAWLRAMSRATGG